MKDRYSKNQLREEIRRRTEEYLSRGGAITSAQPGESGMHQGALQRPVFVSGAPRQERTYLNDVVSALDERKKQKAEKPKAKKTTKPRKKIIYDDFGEPLREVWVEE